MKAPIFYSKILLFGEYGIIKDSKGLSIPFNYFKGGLKVGDSKNENQKISNNNLKKFRDYLSKINKDIVKFDKLLLQKYIYVYFFVLLSV